MAPGQNRALEANARADAKLAEAISQFAPKVTAAREQVEAMTPKLSELAKNTSDALQRSQEQTQQTAQAAENNQPAEQTAQQANALMPQAREDAKKLSDLQAALRQEPMPQTSRRKRTARWRALPMSAWPRSASKHRKLRKTSNKPLRPNKLRGSRRRR